MQYRIEKDTMGEVKVPLDAYYGAQTQRSIENFKIAQDINRMPKEIIRAFAHLKKAAALTNMDAGVLPKNKAALIGKVCDEILDGKLDAYFPKQYERERSDCISRTRAKRRKADR
jgi:fumarate hydratase class II